MYRRVALLTVVASLLGSITPGTAAAGSFVNFETGQVRPLAMSPDGTRLFAVNTPDNRLEIFALDAGVPTHTASVPVGLEPISVAARNDGEVWVVNHVSDSVSIVDVAATPPRVRQTLLTCDEPRDIVFAGPGGDRAFVTTARRGQNCPVPFDFSTAGIGRAVVQVFDAANTGGGGGTPIANVVLFGDTPRALARSADGNTVYAAVFHSGNETTTVGEGAVCDGGSNALPCGTFLQFPGGLPAPNVNVENVRGPEVGLIVRMNPATTRWEDGIGRNWNAAVRFELPDLDVFAIDAAAPSPAATASFAHVGTVLFDMAVNPANGKVYVSNTEARNEVRFEGPGLAFGSTTVQGHLHEARITVLDGASVLPRHLNKHIDYSERPAPAGVKERSLATPLGMAVSANGATLYVAAFGSDKVGIFDTAELESNVFVPDAADHIGVSGGGPTGLLLDEPRDRLYVFTRFDNAISVIDVATREETDHVPLFDPEPAPILVGRRFLYDAVATSSNGEASCSSCHIFGDLDQLAWDLGNPDDVVVNNPIPQKLPPLAGTFEDFHPLKGPMITQSLRGMANHGSMHWRGDRTGGNDPGGNPFDEDAAFKKFNAAFPGLIGREAPLTAAEMQAFTDFILTVTYPPNPIRSLDNTLTTNQRAGHDLYFGRSTDAFGNCNGCHTLDPAAGSFGTEGESSFGGGGAGQMFKVPHLRNAYQKVGMFGGPSDAARGPQIRGFGFLNDGSVDTIRRFLSAGVFDLTDAEQNDLESFVLAYDSNVAPIVGQQITLTSTSPASVATRIDLLFQRANALECDVIVKGTIAGEQRGGVRIPGGAFQLDRAVEIVTDASLRALAGLPGQELTYTCVPPGSGQRTGVDRDDDGAFDRDEIDAGTDPTDAASIASTLVRASALTLRDGRLRKIAFRSSKYRGVASGVVVPPAGSISDPTAGGASLTIYDADGGAGRVDVPLPAGHWTRTGTGARVQYRYVDKIGASGPITTMKIRDGKLTLRGQGAGLYPLASAPQGVVALRLKLGPGIEYCAAAPAKAPATANDVTTKFVATRNFPAPAVCPPMP